MENATKTNKALQQYRDVLPFLKIRQPLTMLSDNRPDVSDGTGDV